MDRKEFINQLRRYQKGSISRRHFLGVTGLGMAQVDFLEAVYGNFPLVLTIICILTFILLVRAFRSLLRAWVVFLMRSMTNTLGF